MAESPPQRGTLANGHRSLASRESAPSPAQPLVVTGVLIQGFIAPPAHRKGLPTPLGLEGHRGEDPIQRLVDLGERLQRSHCLQQQWIEEIQQILEGLSTGWPPPWNGPPPAAPPPPWLPLSETTEPPSVAGEEGERITYGTDRLRTGAGACELVCSQSVLFDLGCLLLGHARRNQGRLANDGL